MKIIEKYTVPVTSTVVVGTEVKEEDVRYCDGCSVPEEIYVELSGRKVMHGDSKPTGLESVHNIFGYYTTDMLLSHRCSACFSRRSI